MAETNSITRRKFVKGAAAAAASLALTKPEHTLALPAKKPAFLVGGFTKKLQELDYEQTADTAAEIGWDGIECPVRPGGHVLPERVQEDLPGMVEALKKRNLEILVMASDIHNVDEHYTEIVLRTAAELGIKYYRLGPFYYKDGPIPSQLAHIKSQLRDLAALNKEFGICGLFQNHSGSRYVGAAVWDVYELIKDLDSDSALREPTRYIAAHFDIGHATVEGGYAWPIHFRLIRPVLGAVIVKDFVWEHTPGKPGRVRWCTLGEGMVDKKFFCLLKESGFNGPVTMHFEYPVAGKNKNQRLNNLITAMKTDCRKLRELLGV